MKNSSRFEVSKQTKKAMKKLIRDTETITVEISKVNLYKKCGWVVLDELFTFKTKNEENEAWFQRFGD